MVGTSYVHLFLLTPNDKRVVLRSIWHPFQLKRDKNRSSRWHHEGIIVVVFIEKMPEVHARGFNICSSNVFVLYCVPGNSYIRRLEVFINSTIKWIGAEGPDVSAHVDGLLHCGKDSETMLDTLAVVEAAKRAISVCS